MYGRGDAHELLLVKCVTQEVVSGPSRVTMTEIQKQIAQYRQHFSDVNGAEAKFFSCPILRLDEETPVCLGHVVPDSLPNSSSLSVIQRQDVDNFFGRTVEFVFIEAVRAFNKSTLDIVHDDKSRRFVRPTIEVEGKRIEYYPLQLNEDGTPKCKLPDDHTLLKVENDDGTGSYFGLKLNPDAVDTISKSNNVQFVTDVDFQWAAIGCMLHSAHLTMFRILNYSYVNSAAGIMLGDILHEFYREYRDLPAAETRQRLPEVFSQYQNMVRPMFGCDERAAGTVTDNRMLTWEGSSGRRIGIGVMVNAAEMMHVVWLPAGDPNTIGEYMSLLKSPPKTMMVRLMEFVIDSNGNGSFNGDRDTMQIDWDGIDAAPTFSTEE